MNILNNKIKKEIEDHAREELPNECCGLIISQEEKTDVIRCENAAENPRVNFRIRGKDYLKGSSAGKIVAYYHSHPEDNVGVFSPADKAASEGHGIPIILFSMKNHKFLQYNN
jgi:proteasome lid subunit RPN8/RPN11